MAIRILTFSMVALSLLLMLWIIEGTCFISLASAEPVFKCQPTPEDEMGPFYRPGAKVRNKVGSGYLLQGTVKSARNCSPINKAKVELWMTGPHGQYGDDWRATLFSAENGAYYFLSHSATDYGARPPHIHIKVSAFGYKTLVTQHYPANNTGIGIFDLVLIPQNE